MNTNPRHRLAWSQFEVSIRGTRMSPFSGGSEGEGYEVTSASLRLERWDDVEGDWVDAGTTGDELIVESADESEDPAAYMAVEDRLLAANGLTRDDIEEIDTPW